MSLGRPVLCVLLVLFGLTEDALASGDVESSLCQPKRRRARRRRPPPPVSRPEGLPEVSASEAAILFSGEPDEASPAARPEGPPSLGARRGSEVTPGAPSRWSNRGALEPIDSPVQLQADLPERNRPRPPGVETPGQRLRGDEELLSARFSLSGYRLSTVGQDTVYARTLENNELAIVEGDRDIELLRGRATLAYERIGGSDFSAHLDVEVRPRLNGDPRPDGARTGNGGADRVEDGVGRFDDQRINALYLAWGLTDSRGRGGPDFGVAVGRVAIREAGFAQADGVAMRWRPVEPLHVGVFGGVTGNPYGFNWALRSAETLSTDWITGGVFGRLRLSNFQLSLAGVYTMSNIPRPPPDPGSSDRVYLQGDAAIQATRELSFFLTGFFDLLPSGDLVQNAELVSTWAPDRFNVTLGLGRFSTVTYALSTGYSFFVDPALNRYDPANQTPIVDEEGNAIIPFDAARLTAVYNQVRTSVGYRLTPSLELFTRANLLIRDVSLAAEQSRAALPGEVPLAATVDFAPLRILPGVGARFQEPDLLDADVQLIGIIDDQSQADAILQAGVGRGLFGLYARADARYVLGAVDALDGGLSLTYSFPRDWFPGVLQAHASFRYFREDVAVERPASPAQVGALPPEATRSVIPVQESFLGFAGVEWRL